MDTTQTPPKRKDEDIDQYNSAQEQPQIQTPIDEIHASPSSEAMHDSRLILQDKIRLSHDTNKEDEENKPSTIQVLEEIDNGEGLISQQIEQQQEKNKIKQSDARNYGFKLPLANLRQQQNQQQLEMMDTDRSLHFEETDNNTVKQSEFSMNESNSNINTGFKQNKQSQSAQYNVKRIQVPNHSKNESAMSSLSPFAFRSGRVGVSQVLALGFSRYQSPMKSPRLLSTEVFNSNRSRQASKSQKQDQVINSPQIQGNTSSQRTANRPGSPTYAEQLQQKEQWQSSQYQASDKVSVSQQSQSSQQPSRLLNTMIRLDSEIKRMRQEPLSTSSREFAERLTFGSEAQVKMKQQSEAKLVDVSNADEEQLTEENQETLAKQNISLKKEIQELKKEIHELKKSKIKTSQINLIQQINKELVTRQKTLVADNEDMQDQLNELQMQLQTMHAECDALTDEKDLAERTKFEEISKYKNECEELKRTILEMNANANTAPELAELNDQLREFQTEKLGLLDKIEGLQKEVLTITAENRNLEKKLKEAIPLLDEKSNKLQALKTQFDTTAKELATFQEESLQLKQQILTNEENFKSFNLTKSNSEESILKMNCQLILRTNQFNRRLVHIESLQDISVLSATDITDLVPSKDKSSTFTIGFRGPFQKKQAVTFEANTRQEMVAACKALKQHLIAAQSSFKELSSVGSLSSRNAKETETNKDFLSSIASFFGN